MNKREQAEMEHLKTLLALRIYPAVEPDVMPPESYREVKNGYLFNAYSGTVSKACTSSGFHSYGNWDKTTTQSAKKLYSTEKLAYQAMMHEMSMEFARKLRLIEIRIKNLKENNAE
jgi:hypothetical protein